MTDREKLIEILDSSFEEQYGKRGILTAHHTADYLIANGVTVQTEKEKPTVDLTNKCGSCKHSVIAENVFGKSKCYVRCTNLEHLNSRMYQERPLAAVRQRTMRACKKYDPLPEPPKEDSR